jgi:hypothetical protein
MDRQALVTTTIMARFRDACPLVSRRNLCPWTRVGIHLMGLYYVVQILLTHRHMRRAIKILLVQLCVCALNPFLCRTHLSTEYQGGFLLISNTPHDMNRAWTWLGLLSGMTWTTLPVVGLMYIPFLTKEILGIRK